MTDDAREMADVIAARRLAADMLRAKRAKLEDEAVIVCQEHISSGNLMRAVGKLARLVFESHKIDRALDEIGQ